MRWDGTVGCRDRAVSADARAAAEAVSGSQAARKTVPLAAAKSRGHSRYKSIAVMNKPVLRHAHLSEQIPP